MNGLMGIKRFQTGGGANAGPGSPIVFPQSIAASSAEQKAQSYATLRNRGYSDADIDAAIIAQFYKGNAADAVDDLAALEKIAQPYLTTGDGTSTVITDTTDTVTNNANNDTVVDQYSWFDISRLGTTPTSKAQYYNQLLAAGYTDAQIKAAANAKIPGGAGTDAQWSELTGLAARLRAGNVIDDTLIGGDGNDTLIGGGTNDIVTITDQYPWFDPTKFSSTDATSKARYYNLLKSAGYTDAQIMAAANAKLPGGIGSPEQFLELQTLAYNLRNPAPVGGLQNLSQIQQTTTQQPTGPTETAQPTRTDFSRLPPELRMAGQYAPLLAERATAPPIETAFRTLDAGKQTFGARTAPLGAEQMSKGLRTAFEIGLGPTQYYENIRTFLEKNPTLDAIAAAKEQYGVSDVDITRALSSVPKTTAAPTPEAAFKDYIYAGGVDDVMATTRGLQYARNLGLTPEQTTNLFNRSLGTNFGLADYDRAVAQNTGLFAAMPQRPTTQVLPSPVMQQAPITGGLAFATKAGGIGAPKYYENIAAALDTGIDPNRILSEMGTYGITTDDLIAARAMFPNKSIQALGSVARTPVDTTTPITVGTVDTGGGDSGDAGDAGDAGDGAARQGGLISRYAGGPVTGSPQYFAEGGESKPEPMKKYTPSELGSTFDVSEYIDPETGRFMINEYRRDVVFGKGLEEAEKEARARMTPEMERMAMRDLMIRQGRTGKEYGLPGIIAGGPATGDIRPLNYYYAKGGLADAARYGYAEELRQQGRNGDTILAHINPTEAKMLEAMGGSGTINPKTGLPEYGFSWKKLFKAASFILPFIPGIGLPARIALSGALAGASTPGKAFDFKRGIQSAIMTYAGAKVGEALGGATKPISSTGSYVPSGETVTIPGSGDVSLLSSYTGPATSSMVTPATVTIPSSGDISLSSSYTGPATPATPNTPINVPNIDKDVSLPSSYSGPGGKGVAVPAPTVSQPKTSFFESAGKELKAFGENPTQYLSDAFTKAPPATMEQRLGGAFGTYTASEAADEAIKAKQEADAILFAQKEDKEQMDELLRRTLGRVGPRYTNPTYVATGGLIALADGGMTGPVNQPRMLAGGGDGMSDSIPATIDGTQPARLADGEFVIPADVVADIGNGSSSAGAKRLYGMMDRVRTARHGTTKQPPEIKMNRLMPA